MISTWLGVISSWYARAEQKLSSFHNKRFVMEKTYGDFQSCWYIHLVDFSYLLQKYLFVTYNENRFLQERMISVLLVVKTSLPKGTKKSKSEWEMQTFVSISKYHFLGNENSFHRSYHWNVFSLKIRPTHSKTHVISSSLLSKNCSQKRSGKLSQLK